MNIIDKTLEVSDPMLEIFEALARYEKSRRTKEASGIVTSLREFEMEYHGIEVGYVRRAINKTVKMVFNNQKIKSLLDYGCGGFWWKDDYWPEFAKVMAVEINFEALEDVKKNYKLDNADLVYTRNGLIDTDERFDYVLSSSVVGYIHPRQAELHLRSCHDLLVPGGTLVLSRVRAYNLEEFKKGTRLQTINHFSFSYAYTKAELVKLLYDHGFTNIKYHEHGVWFPRLNKLNQQLYKYIPKIMTNILPKLLPFLRFQHMYTAERE